MIFMFMMGYEVDFGHMEIINCLTAQKYSEKHVGYVGISLLLKNTDEMMTLVINSIQQDLQESDRNEVQCLALAGIANIGGQMLTDAVGAMVVRMLIDHGTAPIVKKKAALTLLRLYRIDPTVIDIEETAPRLALLLEDRNLGVVTCVASLILAMCTRERTGTRRDALNAVIAPCVMRLTQLGLHRACSPDYLYYSTASPWIQVKILQILQQFPSPTDEALTARLDEVLNHILSRTEVTKSVNKNNADHAILFEACNLIINYCASRKDKNKTLRDQAVKLLARFISVREPNIRYLGLSSMTKLAKLGDVGHLIAEHQARILFTLKDGDISIRRRALDLVFAMCSSKNAESLVDELLNYLVRAEPDIRAEMILKIAVLAERFQTNLRWYVDTILRIISTSGQHVSEEIWHRVVQIITNDEDLQPYATAKVFETLQAAGPNATESLVSLASYVVGEFGDLLVDAADGGVSTPIPPEKIFATLQAHFPNVSKATQAIMLSTYVKMYHLFGEAVGADIAKLYQQMSTDLDVETQQRAVEYIQVRSVVVSGCFLCANRAARRVVPGGRHLRSVLPSTHMCARLPSLFIPISSRPPSSAPPTTP
jgi:AP-2 complex subunit alpha